MRVAVTIDLSEADRLGPDRWRRFCRASRRPGPVEDSDSRWKRRFAGARSEGIARDRLRSASRRGKSSTAQAGLKGKVILPATQTEAPAAAHWSCRSMVRAAGTRQGFVHRAWRSLVLAQTFKACNDARSGDKLRDVAGLYLNPAENAAVSCLDDPMLAPELTQPDLPLKAGRCGSVPLCYTQWSTASLCAAVEVALRPVIRQTYERCRAVLQFLRQVENALPGCRKIRVILDTCATCRPPAVMDRIERQERIFLRFAPARASWLSLIKRRFGVLAERQLRRGAIDSVQDPERSPKDCKKTYNENPRPLVWKKTADGHLDNAARARYALAAISA